MNHAQTLPSHPRRRRALGILTLADPHSAPTPPPRGFDEADWFKYPTMIRAVPGAYAREVVRGNLALTDAFVAAAKEMEAAGCAAITADCGYAIAYQEAIRDAVSIPVACSSLMQLPLIRTMLPKHGRIGVLCFDRDGLTANHLKWAGVPDGEARLAVGSIQGTYTWQNWIAADTTTDWEMFEQDFMSAARLLLKQNRDITHWLLECTCFPRMRPLLVAETGRPAYDWVSLCNHMMECAAPRMFVS